MDEEAQFKEFGRSILVEEALLVAGVLLDARCVKGPYQQPLVHGAACSCGRRIEVIFRGLARRTLCMREVWTRSDGEETRWGK